MIDIDLFQCFEDSVSTYKDIGSIIVAGDINATTSIREDFILKGHRHDW